MLMSLMCAVLIALYLFLLLRQRRRSIDDEA
jgi:multiple sugar transport system permease protein